MKFSAFNYLLLLATFCFSFLNIGLSQSDCHIVGFWVTEVEGKMYYQDFNDGQILAMDDHEGGCRINRYASYTIKGDTILIENSSGIFQPSLPPIKVLIKFITCDSMHMFNMNEEDGTLSSPVPYKRAEGHSCDKPSTYVKSKPFLSRKKVRETGFYIFVFIYFSVLIIWIILFFKGEKEKRIKLWWFLAFLCFLFCFTDIALIVLFVIHSATGLIYFLRNQSSINEAGRVLIYGLYASFVILFEYAVRYGFDTTYFTSYTTLIPALVNLLGFRLVYEVVRLADDLGFRDSRVKWFVGIALLFLPQIIVFSQREDIFIMLKNLIS